MKEIWEQAILPYNLPLTILLGLVICFWILTLIGLFGIDSFDADLDVDANGDLSHLGEIPAAMLRVVNAGSVPVTIVLSILALCMWLGSIVLNYYFNPSHSGWLAAGFIVTAFVIGVIATKALTQPLVPLMRRLKQAEDAPPVIGCAGIVRSIAIDSEYGQVEVERPDGAPALLNARLSPDAESAPRGTPVLIISLDETKGVYLARVLPPSPPID